MIRRVKGWHTLSTALTSALSVLLFSSYPGSISTDDSTETLLLLSTFFSPTARGFPVSHIAPINMYLFVCVCVCVCVCVFIKLHITAQSGLVILVILCHSHFDPPKGGSMILVTKCVCVFIILHITAQSGLVILVILCHSH